MRWMFIGIWVIAVTSLSSFVWLTRVPGSNQHEYYTSVISANDALNHMTVYGKILIHDETTLVPLSDGNVTDVAVKAGDKVSAGQVLATLDFSPEDLEQFEKLKKLSADSGSVEALNENLATITKLEKSGFYDALEAAKKRSEIYSSISQFLTYRSNLQKQFDQTHGKILRAPFDGIVTDVRLKKGQRISVRDERAEISISVAPLTALVGVEMEIGDELLGKLKVGQEISVSVPLAQVQGVKGTVESVAQLAFDDKKKRYFKAIGKLHLESESKVVLASGMKVVVDVNTAREENLTWIPKAALDIHLDEKNVSTRMSFIPKGSRSIASSRSDDFHLASDANVDDIKDQSSASRLVGNDVFPNESNITEIYLLTADNRVIQASIKKVAESGEMIAVEGKDLRGMRVITHYRPKESLW